MTRRLHPSRLPLLAAGALLAVPLLGGCGFDYATDRVNTISAGVNDRDDTVDVLGAVVIANQDDVGAFGATLVNNDGSEEATLESVSLDGQEAELPAGAGEAIAPRGLLNLFDAGGVEVSGDFAAGDFVEVELSFAGGQVTTLQVNVVPACRQFSPDRLPDLELPETTGSTGSESTESESTESESTESGSTEEAEGEAHSEELPDAYSCDPIPPVDHHAE